MKLMDRGLVSMDDHPAEYVPEAAGFDKQVTVYHMLHHISGMTDFAQHAEYERLRASNEKQDMRKLVSELSEYPMRFAPGTDTQYANINFTLCALIIENVTGIPYAEYIMEQVIRPLGMDTAAVDEPGLEIAHRVIGMDVEKGVLVPVGNNVGWLMGGGDLIGTVNDVYRLNHAIKKKMLLSKAMWKEALTPAVINNFGCGCSVACWNGKTRIQHNGGHVGFRTLHVQILEDDLDIILLANCGKADPRQTVSEAVCRTFYE